MRSKITSKRGTTKEKALILILLFLISSCATWDSGPQSKKHRRDPGTPEERSVPKDIKRPAGPELAAMNTPARKASMNMVASGKQQMNRGRFEKALGIFQEAVMVDSTNGVAYYYMAKSRFYLNQHEEAMGILDKAESLLGSSEEWMEATSLLRSEIQKGYLREEEEGGLIPIINRPE